jgi:glycosyltransferase involved in cell wall biosynthesis
MKPVFSIITVTYNASQWLEQTIRNVLSQSYSGIEYLIIDGGSTDGTIDIIKQYESGLSYWISEPDKGLYDAMNKGLEAAKGDYVWFINAGDRLYDGKTAEYIVDGIQKNDLPDVIYGETRIMNENGKDLGFRRLRPPEKLTWKSFKMGMLVCHQSFIVKKRIAPQYDLQYRFSADFDWCIQCLKKAEQIYNTHQILSCFLESGLTVQNRKISLQERYRIMCRYYGKIPTQIRHLWFAVRFYTTKWFCGSV